MSTFGNYFKITTFGESHCQSVGVTINSPPPNMNLDLDKIQNQLNRRRPGQSAITTPRDEKDKLIVLSGMENGKTLGTPLTIIVNNLNTKPEDYVFTKDTYIPRPSHSDFTYLWKYGIHASSGGGRSSARETIGRVIAGAVAEQILDLYGISAIAHVSQVGTISCIYEKPIESITREDIDNNITRCPNKNISKVMEDLILELKQKGDSIGGKVTCIIKNCPKGLGEPVFDRTEALLAQAMLSIPATKGFEIGSGFNCVTMNGSNHNDRWVNTENGIGTETNNNGGTVGGITNGENIMFSVAFKPPATILMDQNTINLKGEDVILKAKGRHDPCVVPRAVPIVEAMANLVLIELLYAQVARKNIISNINATHFEI